MHQYAATAESAGVKVIWPLKEAIWRNGGNLASYYPTLASGCGSCGHDEFVRYVVNLVKNLPATWGYYIGDEVSPAEAPQVAALAALIKSVDPGHPLLLVANETAGTGANVNPLTASADVIGADSYPWNWPDTSLAQIGSTAHLMQSIATATQRQSAMVLQAFDWASYPEVVGPVSPTWPTEAVMREERDQALANGSPALLLWYSLFDIQRSADPVGHWADLQAAAIGPLPAAGTTTARPGTSIAAKSRAARARCARYEAKHRRRRARRAHRHRSNRVHRHGTHKAHRRRSHRRPKAC
jgi:hypothetical protein